MAGWDIISAISNEANLLQEENHIIEAGTISDTMIGEAQSWFPRVFRLPCMTSSPPEPVLIKAPTGSGKSTFVMKDLCKMLKERIPGGRILLLTNRKALCLQQRIIGNANSSVPPLGTRTLSEKPIWDNLDIISYQEAIFYITHDIYKTISQVKIVVCDEAHFFCSDSTFNSHTSDILHRIIAHFFMQKRIYMTATPDEVKPIILFEEKYALEGYITQEKQRLFAQQQGTGGNSISREKELQRLDNVFIAFKLKNYEFPDDFSYVHLHFVHEWESIIRSIKEVPEDKWLIFVSNIELGEQLKKKLGSLAVFFNADSKGEDKNSLLDLVRREYFDTNALISTTVLYNGVNFRDDCLKHIVVDSISQVELIQMLGRKRLNRTENETVNLYVMVPKEKELASRLNLIWSNIEMTKSFQRDPIAFFRDKWERQNVDENIQKLFGVPDPFRGTFIGMSQYAPYELGLQEGAYENCLDALKKGNHAFEDLICGWLHKEYSDEMKYDEDLEDLKEKIKPDVIACFEKYREESPFPQEIGEAFWQEIYDTVVSINETLGFRFRHLDSDGKSRWQSDLNGINNVFNLFYKVSGGKKKGYSVALKTEKTKIAQNGQSANESGSYQEIPVGIEDETEEE